jgi:hypothetical protein
MIDMLLDDFIREIKTDQALLHETAFAALMGDHEEYFQRKLAYSIRNSPNILSDDTVAIESKKCDLVFFDSSNSKEIHFLELKAMTFPLKGQGFGEFKKKCKELKKQLGTRCNQGIRINCVPWGLFVFIDFNDEFIASYAKKSTLNYPPYYDLNGIFQKHDFSSFSSKGSSRNMKNIFGVQQNPWINWIRLPLSNKFSLDAELRIGFWLTRWAINSTNPADHVAEPPQQIIQLLGNVNGNLSDNFPFISLM